MNTIDVAVSIFLLIGAYTGFRKGLLMEIISLVAFFIAIILGIKLVDHGVSLLSGFISGYDYLLPILVFLIIFSGVLFGLHLVGRAMKRMLDMTLLGGLDNLVGSLMGVIKWALFISISLWIFSSFGGKIDSEMTGASLLYEPISSFAPKLFEILSDLFPSFIQFFQDSINTSVCQVAKFHKVVV